MNKNKRIKNRNKRANTRAKIVQSMTQKLLDDLAMMEEGLTPPKVVKAHTEYYFTCNPAEQAILLDIFAQREDEMQTKIAEYYTEKRKNESIK